MTPTQFSSFIRGILRSASLRWAPIGNVLKKARVERGMYKCAVCQKIVPVSAYKELKNGKIKKVKNIVVDHIEPVIDPRTGFTTWDDYIARMFVREEGLQAICYSCHEKKSNEERRLAKERRAIERI